MKTIIIFLFVAMFLGCISCNDSSEIDSEQPLNIVELYNSNDDDCSIYALIFNHSNYIFRYALSGPCEKLSSDVYIEQFDLFYNRYVSEYGCKEGLILIEFYEDIGDNLEIVTALRELIKKAVTPKHEFEVKVVQLGKEAAMFEIIKN